MSFFFLLLLLVVVAVVVLVVVVVDDAVVVVPICVTYYLTLENRAVANAVIEPDVVDTQRVFHAVWDLKILQNSQ